MWRDQGDRRWQNEWGEEDSWRKGCVPRGAGEAVLGLGEEGRSELMVHGRPPLTGTPPNQDTC